MIRVRHGCSKTRLYFIWQNMKQRCLNNNTPTFHYYGGKGISICDDWLTYLKFEEWANSSGYTNDMTIDRLDCGGNYEPDNCRWLSKVDNVSRVKRSRISGYKGVYPQRDKWFVRISINGKVVPFYGFTCPESAACFRYLILLDI